MLITKFLKCSVDVKYYIFKTQSFNMYCSAMWFDSTKSAMKKLKKADNNRLQKLLTLPPICSAVNCLTFHDLENCSERFVFSLMSRNSSSIY